MVQLIQAVRSYTNYREEGRVRLNQLFAVDHAHEIDGRKLTIVKQARANVLIAQGLMRVFDPGNTMQPLHRTPVAAYAGLGKAAQKAPIQTQRRAAAAATMEAAPKAPVPLANPSPKAPERANQAGGKNGATASLSSSPAARPPSNVPLPKRRGKRTGSKSSPSTTLTNSPPGPASSTPATGNGGAPTKAAPPSKA